MEGDGVLSTLTASSQRSTKTAAAEHRQEAEGTVNSGETERTRSSAMSGCAGSSYEAIVTSLFEAFSRRDLASTLPLLHREVVFQPVTAQVTQAGKPYCGHDGIRRYARDIAVHWDELTVRPAQIRAAGRAVVAIGVVSGRGAAGSFADVPTTWVVKFRDGLVSHVQIFSDTRWAHDALVGGDA
jgi:ketosteroid isomerase-like protein